MATAPSLRADPISVREEVPIVIVHANTMTLKQFRSYTDIPVSEPAILIFSANPIQLLSMWQNSSDVHQNLGSAVRW